MIGDVLKLVDRDLPAILYHTHENALMGSLIRVFCSTGSDPQSIDRALAREPDLQCFFPVKAALRIKVLAVIERRPPQGRWADFPLFKAEGISVPGHPRGPSWLWDGVREWIYEGEEAAISGYPEREIVNDTRLISRIEKLCPGGSVR